MHWLSIVFVVGTVFAKGAGDVGADNGFRGNGGDIGSTPAILNLSEGETQ